MAATVLKTLPVLQSNDHNGNGFENASGFAKQ